MPSNTESEPAAGKRRSIVLALAAIAISTAALAYGALAHGRVERECRFLDATGRLCPLCGGTRAMWALAHGRVGQALRCHAVAAVFVPVALAGGLLALALPSKREKLAAWLWAFGGMMGWVWLGYWIIRLASVGPE